MHYALQLKEQEDKARAERQLKIGPSPNSQIFLLQPEEMATAFPLLSEHNMPATKPDIESLLQELIKLRSHLLLEKKEGIVLFRSVSLHPRKRVRFVVVETNSDAKTFRRQLQSNDWLAEAIATVHTDPSLAKTCILDGMLLNGAKEQYIALTTFKYLSPNHAM